MGITEYAEIALVERLTELLRKRGGSIDLRLRSIAKVKYVELLDDGGIDAFVGHADEVPPRFLSASLLKDPWSSSRAEAIRSSRRRSAWRTS